MVSGGGDSEGIDARQDAGILALLGLGVHPHTDKVESRSIGNRPDRQLADPPSRPDDDLVVLIGSINRLGHRDSSSWAQARWALGRRDINSPGRHALASGSRGAW